MYWYFIRFYIIFAKNYGCIGNIFIFYRNLNFFTTTKSGAHPRKNLLVQQL